MKRVWAWPGGLGALDVEVYDNGLLTAAHDDCFYGLIYGCVHFLMWNIGRHIDKVAGPGFLDVLQLIAPAETGSAADDVEDGFQFAVMMRAGAGGGLHYYCSSPELARPGAGMCDRSFAGHAGSLRRVGVKLARSDDFDAVVFPIGHMGY
jgi:hypothetical protein